MPARRAKKAGGASSRGSKSSARKRSKSASAKRSSSGKKRGSKSRSSGLGGKAVKAVTGAVDAMAKATGLKKRKRTKR
jgi:hypothetical protein